MHRLEYEAYEGQAERRMLAVADEARTRWPVLGRIALLHRTGVVAIGEAAVVVAVSAPHRDEAFAGARFAIDTLKRTAVLLSVGGSLVLWLRHRSPTSVSSGIDAFQREMKALRPPPERDQADR